VPLSPDLFKRLSALNRQRLGEHLTTADAVRADGAPAEENEPSDDASPVTIEALGPGCECEAGGGRYWLLTRGAEAFLPALAEPDPAGLLARYPHVVGGAGRAVEPDALHQSLHPLIGAEPGAIAYLDIETCGLAGEPVFLVGLLVWEEGRLAVRQYLARDYAEERALLEGVWQGVAEAKVLVTYNGKTFDVPTLGARSLACGFFDLPPMPAHVDLLAEARRRWRHTLPNCRLQTVERAISARRRRGDIPGSDIPAAYHGFVRARQTGDAVAQRRGLRRLQTILHHNALDLLTLAEVVVHILSGGA